MGNVKVHEPLGNSDHNQIHFDIKLKSESTNKKNTGKTSTNVDRYEKILSKARLEYHAEE